MIITGEHSVVYGEPAMLAAVDIGTEVLVKTTDNGTVKIQADGLSGVRRETVESIVNYWMSAMQAWEEFYKKGKSDGLEKLREDEYVVVLAAMGLCLKDEVGIDGGFEVEVKSKLPVGAGMGSSASVAVAVIGSLGRLLGKSWGLGDIRERGYEVEKIIHGKPSGGDPTIVVYGGFLRFQKRGEKFDFRRLRLNKEVIPELALVMSGRPAESTGDMVGMVIKRLKSERIGYRALIKKMGGLSEKIIESFLKGEFEGSLIQENERLLEELGVVGEKAKRMIGLIEKAGGAAKITGAGGIKGGSGVLMAYHNDKEKLGRLIANNGWESIKVNLGGRGWRVR